MINELDIIESTIIDVNDNNEKIYNVNGDIELTLVVSSNASNITINVLSNSKLSSLIINNGQDCNLKINILDNATATGIIGHFGNGNIYDEINLLDYNSKVDYKLVAMANDDELNINAKIDHLHANTEGLMKAYCIANRKGKILFDGVNHIGKGMAKSVSDLHIRGLILSEDAKISANPSLLIDEFDVKAAHGATIGKISDEGLYYLMSRGITKNDATILIINGFLTPIIESIKNEDIKNKFKALSENKL